jgi:hypothetical protein
MRRKFPNTKNKPENSQIRVLQEYAGEKGFWFGMGKQARFPGGYPVSARNRLIERPMQTETTAG